MWKKNKKKIKLKEYFVLLLLLFSVVVIVMPSLVSADDPTIDPYVAPGAPDGISMDQLFKIGILHDMNHLTGEHAWNGAMLAAREINEAGGLFINSNQYYIGLVAENTFEAELALDIDKGIDAANTMIADYDPHIIMGGFRNDALIHYIEPIMDAKIPFICTGSAQDIFSQNVLDNYPRYKYFFRTILNGSKLVGDLLRYIDYLANTLAEILNKDVTKVAFLREDLEWTLGVTNAMKIYLPLFGLEVVEDIVFSYGSSEQDLKDFWYQIDASGAQIVVPLAAEEMGVLIGRTYGEVQPKCIMCGINVAAQLENYWDVTYGGGQYEISIQGTYKTEKTPKTIPFWNNYVSNYSLEPYYTAVSSYDAIYLLSNATLSTQSFNADQIVFGLEQINSTTTITGVFGNIAFTSSHDLLGGPDYGSMLFCQWQEGGNKVVLPCGNMLYPDSFATGSLTIPPWGINSRELIYGVGYGPDNLEPLNAWESNSIDVIDQVVESLFAYNVSDPDLGIILSLASDFGTWSLDNLNYTVDLKQDVLFHDGTPFNASAVQWNFDRLAYFMNVTGSLPEEVGTARIGLLFELPDGTPIINRTEVIETYKIRFVLNRPFAALEAILSFWGTGILSPTSTPEMEYIDTLTGDLIGTGPYEYDEYIDGTKVRFHAFEDYRDGVAELNILKFLIIPDDYERNEALLSGVIDFLDNPSPSMIETFEEDPYITVERGQNTVVRYISMNNNRINKTMRQAISYSIDYSYIIDVLYDGEATRLKSPLPEGILYANWSFNVANFNITKARQILVSEEICNFDVDEDNEWLDATANNPIAIYNYSYYWESPFRENLGFLLEENLAQIGVRVDLKGLDWEEFIDRYLWDYEKLELFYIGWAPDFNDPSNYINTMFSNSSNANLGRVNDPILQELIEEGLTEVDPIAREAVYDEIQRYIVEDLMPHAYVSVGLIYDVYQKGFTGYQSNSMGKVWFYSVKFQDVRPPHTEINMFGAQSSYGWFESEVTITFSAIDDYSGVATTEYSFDGETWNTYIEPIIISEEGVNIIYCRSIDYKGNEEEIKMEKICIYYFISCRDLVFGTRMGLFDLDPVHAWDYDSWNVLDQVVEGLFALNLTHPETDIIPRLAKEFGTWSEDKLNYTVDLEQGVLFHDGTPFNAPAVQWSFNRLAYFMNITGSLPEGQRIANIESLYRWPDWTPIINRVEIIDTYTVRFVLNRPYAALEALLTFTGSAILSPTSTPEIEYIDTHSDTIIGTGPFKYEFYIYDKSIKFDAFEGYWAGPPDINSLIFSIIEDEQERNNALLSGEVDFILNPVPSMFDAFETDPSITLHDAGNTGLSSYIGMNNRQINRTMRQAISYAINYSYIINEILEGQGIRLKSPLPKGIRFANWSLNVATMNVTKARQILLEAGVVSGLNPSIDSEWTDLVDYGTPIATYNYSYNIENWRREAIFFLLQENLRQIGIEVIDAGMEWEEYLWRLFDSYGRSRDMLQIFELGWLPDFNDPSNYLNSQFSNEGWANIAQVNDPYLEDLLAQGLVEVDHTIRKTIYDKIQRYLVEDLMPWAFTYTGRNFYAYNDEFTGYEPNTMQRLYFNSVSRVPPCICNETAEWGVEAGDKLIWEASGWWLEMAYNVLFQEDPVQWMLDIEAINLTYWEDLPSKTVPCDFYSTIWATMYNRSVTEGAPWEEWMPLFPLTFYNACESLIYNQFFGSGQNWPYLVIPVPVNLEILNISLSEFLFYGVSNINSSIKDNSLQYVLDTGFEIVTLNYTYNNQGILTRLFILNSTEHIWIDIRYDPIPPNWTKIPTDQEVELGSRLLYNVSAYDEYGIDHYWISDTEHFEINSSGWIVDKDFLEVGVYELEVRAYDPHDNYCSATITVTVVDSTSPFGIGSIYDTIPDINLPEFLTYTRTPQIIGSVKVFDHSPIANVELWSIDPFNNEIIAEGFVLDTTHHPKSPFGVYDYRYTSDIVIMTTSLLREGVHSLNLRVYDTQGNVANKYFNITVFRLLNLKLSGEFDYLIREDVKISIVANLLDAETNMQVDSAWISDMGVVMHIIIWGPQGNNLSLDTTEMTHISGGVFRWQSDDTIKKLFKLFDKGVYRVSAYVEFNGSYDPSLWYYRVNQDVIQFHIDPPVDQEPDLWITFTFVGYGGLIILNLVLLFFYRRKHRRR